MPSPDSLVRRTMREPLVHFALLAAGVFAIHRVIAPGSPEPDVIVVSDAFVDGLRDRHRRMHGGDPDEGATRGLVRHFVRDEVLVREARRLGMDQDDPIVRRRLVQKMELFLEATTDLAEPSEEELERARTEGASRYRAPERVAFEHVFFRSARSSAEDDARATLAALASEAPPDPTTLGDPFLLGRALPARSLDELAGSFGAGFARALAAAPLGAWSGPHESSYGWHVLKIGDRTPAALPPLDAIRERVRADLLRERREQAVRERIDALVASYRTITLP